MGDAISETPALSFLDRMGVEVIVLSTSYTSQIFENNPHVYRNVTYSRKKRDGLIKAGLVNYNVVNEIKQLAPDAFLCMFRQIRELERIYSHFHVPVLSQPLDDNLPIYMRWVEFFKMFGFDAQSSRNEIYPGEKDIDLVEQWMYKTGVDLARPAVVIHPGCAVSTKVRNIANELKYWPIENYLELFSCFQKDFQIILTGIHPSEIEANNNLKRESPLKTEIFDQPNIRSLAWLISKSSLLITLDTGILHIGAATETPIIALFGPSDPDKYGPWGANISYIRTDSPVACWPCDLNATCGGDNICMTSINPEKVVASIVEHIG